MKKSGIRRLALDRRYLTILLGMALFLPPFAVIPQIAGEVNLCGAACPRMFLIFSPTGIIGGFEKNIPAAWLGASLVALILLSTFFMGRVWCSHLCPIGGTTEIASRALPERFKADFSFMHAPAFRYAYLFIFFGCALMGIGSIACKLCNFRVIPFLAGSPFVPAYRSYLLSSAGIAGLATVLATGFLARGGRAYCNLLCPVGGLDSIANFLSAKLGFTRKVRTDPAKCTGCAKCTGTCMVWALGVDENRKVSRDQSSCMSCRECIGVCPEKAIRYGKS